MNAQILKTSKIKVNPNNPRIIKDDKFKKLVQSIVDFPKMLEIRPIVVNKDMMILGGNMRFKACLEVGLSEVPVIVAKDLTPEQEREFLIKDNISGGEWDWDTLANEWDSELLEDWGLDIPMFNDEIDKKAEAHEKLKDTFLVPPFSILDTRQGYWSERKAYWRELIQDFGESREDVLGNGNMLSEINNGTSLLDPVLSEIINKWFCVPDAKTFDCFAGDSVFGYVSSYLGHSFTGIELREEQAKLNNERVKGFNSLYICDDGQNVTNHIQPQTQDLLFSCPPYFDLEVYSDLPNDASNQKEYSDFLKILDNAFTNAIKCLKDNRFAVITVGDIRDKKGFYYRFVDHIKDIFNKNNMLLYNELILIEPIGTLPQRAGKFMDYRKVGKCHQNVLVFYKGDPKRIKEIFPKIKTEEDESANTQL